MIGTFAAFAGTLAAYKFFDIKVSNKFRMVRHRRHLRDGRPQPPRVVLGLFGASLGFFGFGAHGSPVRVAGLVLGVFMLILDFDFVEQRHRAPASRSASRGGRRSRLTVSLVWIYTNLLRILAIIA